MSPNNLSLEPALVWPWQRRTEPRVQNADGIFLRPPPQQQQPPYCYYHHHHHHYHHHHRAAVLAEGGGEREHLFEKPLTPSDVGKLNRLVIPKQHAERYFPLDGDSGEKGLVLSFEDEAGKAWRFRYSYWTSSQSYVLTKGWSRFVKEKHLDAGDVVMFERRRGSRDSLFIGWKRRAGAAPGGGGGGSGLTAVPAAAPPPPNPPAYYSTQGSLHDSGERGGEPTRPPSRALPAPAGSSSRRLRLFGVNLDCGTERETTDRRQVPGGGGGGSCTDGRDLRHRQFTHAGGASYPRP